MAINYQGGDTALWGNAVSSTLSLFQKMEQQNSAKRAATEQSRKSDLETASKEIAKLDSNGIREVDVKDISTKFNGLKDTYFKMSKAKSAEERLQLNFELNRGISDINRDVAKSKEALKYASEGYKLMSNDKYATDKLKSEAEFFANRPVSEIYGKTYDGYSSALKGFDSKSAQSTISTINKSLLNDLDKVSVDKRSLGNGLQGISTSVYPENAMFAYNVAYDKDDNFRAYVDDLAAKSELGITETLGQIAQQEASLGTLSKSTVGNVPQARKGITVNVNTGTSENTPEAAIVTNYDVARDVKTGKLFTADKYVQFNQAQPITGVMQALDPETGKTEEMTGTINTLVTGVAHARGKDWLVITDEDGYNKLVDKNKYLNKLSLTKSEVAGLNRFDKEVGALKKSNESYAADRTPTTTATISSTKKSEVDALKKAFKNGENIELKSPSNGAWVPVTSADALGHAIDFSYELRKKPSTKKTVNW